MGKNYNPDGARVFNLDAACAGLRLDQALARLLPEHSRSRLQSWIAQGRVWVDGREAVAKTRVYGGETVTLDEPPPAPTAHAPEARAVEVVFEDDSLLVINKPAGWVVHPGSGNPAGTLLNALLHHAPALAAVPRAGIVHRLDKDTSGLLVVAKTLEAQTALVRQLQARDVHREYRALVTGRVPGDGRVEGAIGRHPTRRTEMAVVARGKPAVTHYQVLERFAGQTWLACRLETGRTHQIRVHMRHIGHPIAADPVYGRAPALGRLGQGSNEPALAGTLRALGRQALHAYRLALTHPASGDPMSWQAEVPDDLSRVLDALRAARDGTTEDSPSP